MSESNQPKLFGDEESFAADCVYHWNPTRVQIPLVFKKAVCICGAAPVLERTPNSEKTRMLYRVRCAVWCERTFKTQGVHQTTDWHPTTKEAISMWVVTHYLSQ